MRWPWSRTEKRQAGYSDTLVQLLVNQAAGAVQTATATGALEAAAGAVSRAFMAAVPEGPPAMTRALTPELLALVGRALIRSGEAVLLIGVDGMTVRLTPAATWDLDGQADPETWTYRLTMPGPSRYNTRVAVPAAAVLHFRYATDPARPWRGVGPLESASLAGKLSAGTLAVLANELSAAHGYLLPVPGADGQSDAVTNLKADLKTLNGKTALVESQNSPGNFGGGSQHYAREWEPRRLGANPPASVVDLQSVASREVLAACGIPPALFEPRGDGAGQREAWRRFLFGVVSPLGRMVAAELQAKLDAGVMLRWDELRASDLAGRARAFQSMVGGGMDVAQAAGLAGLMAEDA